jgi:hypothetical protein
MNICLRLVLTLRISGAFPSACNTSSYGCLIRIVACLSGNVACIAEIQYVRKVAVHLGYGTYIWMSVPKLPLQCAVVSLYSVVKQRLKCNTGKECECLIQFLLRMVL